MFLTVMKQITAFSGFDLEWAGVGHEVVDSRITPL
jgi:hypothetical protein